MLSDEPKPRDQQLALFTEAEQNGHGVRLTDPRALVIEAVWARCHEEG
jgi:hypothetical protein